MTHLLAHVRVVLIAAGILAAYVLVMLVIARFCGLNTRADTLASHHGRNKT